MAFYKFVRIEDPDALRQELLAFCEAMGLLGTILLAAEGINGTIAGLPAAIDGFLSKMRADPRFADIDFKPSLSEDTPFHRMLVKVKAEIVTMGVPDIDPANFTGHYVEPLELKRWLDAGEDIVLVDTRNDYEVRLGTFQGAIDPDLKTFRTFPAWADKALADRKGAKVVTFCTGGIRCEKATAYMRQNGFEDVWQLRGGILKYFEDVAKPSRGSDKTHYEGHCFVFDYRVAVDQTLTPAQGHALCYACRAPLTEADLASKHYVYEKQCPYCVGKMAEKEREAAHHRKATNAAGLARRRNRSRAKAAEVDQYRKKSEADAPEAMAP